MTSPTRAVFFALDDHPRNIFGLEFALPRIREFNPTIPIHVFRDGDPRRLPTSVHAATNVQVHLCKHLKVVKPRYAPPSFLKWYAAASLVQYDEILYFDTDTMVFDDVQELFDAGRGKFHARAFRRYLEGPRRWGMVVVQRPVGYDARIDDVSHALGIKPVEHFNSGIMLFREGFHRDLAGGLPLLERLLRVFALGILPMPVLDNNPSYIDEICGRLLVVMVGLETFSPVEEELAPYYHEYLAGGSAFRRRGRSVEANRSAGVGVAIHTCNTLYDLAISEFGSSEELARLVSLRPRLPFVARLTGRAKVQYVRLMLALQRTGNYVIGRRLRNRVARWVLGYTPPREVPAGAPAASTQTSG